MSHKPRLMLLDDEPFVLAGMKANVSGQYDFSGFTEPGPFIDAVLAHRGLAILIVDHDLNKGSSLTGYDVVRRIRRDHPYGLILPIIYFSAREHPNGYTLRTAEELAFSPTALIPKAGEDEEAVYRAIDRAADLIGQLLAISAEQALQQALLSEGLGEEIDIFEEPSMNVEVDE